MTKIKWYKVTKVEDSGNGYERVFNENRMIATVDIGFTKIGDEVRIYRGRLEIK